MKRFRIAACAAVCALAAAQDVPQRNLLVELRTTSERTDALTGGGVNGGPIVVGPGGVSGSARIGADARSRNASSGVVQRVVVLNGGEASFRVARQLPWQFFQVLWTAQGATLTPTTLWAESAHGFSVRPRWPGGEAPAQVEVAAQGAAGNARLLTTVQLPLGQWTTIAGVEREASSRERGVLTGRDVEHRYDEVVQMRVSDAASPTR